jgi:hypothetical protein
VLGVLEKKQKVAKWFSVKELPILAIWRIEILKFAVQKLIVHEISYQKMGKTRRFKSEQHLVWW